MADFLQERLFDPLGMTDTGYNLSTEQASKVVQVHQLNEQGKLENHPRQIPTQGNTVFGGTHGLFSTAKDYLTFVR